MSQNNCLKLARPAGRPAGYMVGPRVRGGAVGTFFCAENMTVALSVSVNWGKLLKFC